MVHSFYYDRISIRSIYDNEIIIYNWLSDNIENLSNVPIQQRFMPPHFNMIFAAINQVTNDITFPKIKLDANNLTCLHDDPDIYYNFTLQKYIRKSNNRVVCGFKLLPDPSKKPDTSQRWRIFIIKFFFFFYFFFFLLFFYIFFIFLFFLFSYFFFSLYTSIPYICIIYNISPNIRNKRNNHD